MIHTILSERASITPDKIAVVQGPRRITYAELDLNASRITAALLRSGLEQGDRVGILSKNSPEYIAAYIGTQRSGGIAVDINFQYSAHEIKKIIGHCGVKILIMESIFIDAAAEALRETSTVTTVIGIERRSRGFQVVRGKIPSTIRYTALGDVIGRENGICAPPLVTEKDTASIVYTSGTTGKPKGVILTHENYLANARSIIEYLHLTEDDKIMVVLPFCYSYGKSLLTTHLMAGGTLVLENSFMYPNTVFDQMIAEQVTGFAGVPSTFAIMLNRSNFRNYGFPNLRYVTQAGGPMPPQHARELADALPNTQIYIMYGQTEATARLTYLDPRELFNRPGSIGKPIPGVEIELIKDNGMHALESEEGEIVAKGCNIMAGYWDNLDDSSKVLRDGKLYTGDIAKKDRDGYLYIVGRRSDMIKSGAHRISPKEIEEVILELPEIHEVSIVGIHDEILGEAIRAVVVLKEGYEMDAHTVQRYCQKNLASFKIPKEIIFTDELPKTISGKVQRYLLKDQIQLNGTV